VRILLVEDEQPISGFVARGLREEGHTVEVVADLASAREALAAGGWDLLLVDRMLPDGDGLQLVREQRRLGSRLPAICLTARDRVAERVEGLYGGADDYLVKPFAFEELLARIAAVSRRGALIDERLTIGDLEIDLAAHRVSRAGEGIRLTAQEFRLLRYLAEHRGRVLSRTRLLQAVWDLHHDPGTNVVDVYMGYLRAKIDRGREQPLLHTVRGVGYVLEERPR
jgi:DNA-binding response OmpR family regulator